jgi:hypothetical protein
MKPFVALVLSLHCLYANALQPPLLERALSCQLDDKELNTLMQELAVGNPALKKPKFQYALPALDVYQLSAPASALGYSSPLIVVFPSTILLAVKGGSVSDAMGKLKLKAEEYSHANRVVRPTVRLIAYQLAASEMKGHLLVGCEYRHPDALTWMPQDDLFK